MHKRRIAEHMVEWYVCNLRKRKVRKARPEEIPQNVIDGSDVSIRDGELVIPKKKVERNAQKNKKKILKKKPPRV